MRQAGIWENTLPNTAAAGSVQEMLPENMIQPRDQQTF